MVRLMTLPMTPRLPVTRVASPATAQLHRCTLYICYFQIRQHRFYNKPLLSDQPHRYIIHLFLYELAVASFITVLVLLPSCSIAVHCTCIVRFNSSFITDIYRVLIKYCVFSQRFKNIALLCFPSVSVSVCTPGR